MHNTEFFTSNTYDYDTALFCAAVVRVGDHVHAVGRSFELTQPPHMLSDGVACAKPQDYDSH